MRTNTIGAKYLVVGVTLAAFVAVLVPVVRTTSVAQDAAAALLQPVVALVVLTAIVVLLWVFVITRYVHAFIYIGFNYVPLRFAAFLTGVFTLAVIWTRFAEQNLNWHLS